jgi:hypothetical protein
MSDDRGPSLQRGLEAGYRFAEAHPEDRSKLRTIARARSASDVAAAVDAADLELAEDDNRVAFCSSFAHGIAKFLIESS